MDEDARLHLGGISPEPQLAGTSATTGLLSALPEGWVMLGRCRIGTAGPASYPTGCWALAHPTTGIALVDVAPDATPNAESRLRRALGAANFWPAFPGYLPVWHGRIELAAWRSLPGIMAEGFSELPPLTVPGKGAWIAAVRMALAEDPAWDVPGAPRGTRVAALPAPTDESEEEEVVPPAAARRPLRGHAALLAGFAATFVLGFASGALLLGGREPPAAAPPAAPVTLARPAAPPAAAVAIPAVAPLPAREPSPPVPEPAATMPAATMPAATMPVATMPVAAPVPPPAPAIAPPAEPVTEAAAVPAAPLPPPPATEAAGADTEGPTETASFALPLPPLAPRAPERKVSQAPPRIDRACSDAQYRFQQGLPLTPRDVAYLREGCTTRR
ncbi:hypothetical protein [Paracraurococcus lichenis]|uniref:Uncharacterized protein n=1 Tax=Paracraurococcus lichenis TaxID=3064888 RepID=A0ABT9E548_9PROT|nr:hypothetical protein [Paracraurococcus sp. LOR1-02]MDO9711200.1 hypothetical protein [Paracraurococcus sp. LOR1-02]